MTLSSATTRSSYAGSGSTGPFNIGFTILDESHLTVTTKVVSSGLETELTLNAGSSGYTVNAALTQITTTEAVASGTNLVIVRNVPITQEIDYLANDPFPSEVNEQGLDKLTQIAQQLNEKQGRAISLSVTSDLTDVTVEDPEAGAVVMGNPTEDGFINGPTADDISNAQGYAAAAAASATSAANYAAALLGTSTTSVLIALGSKSFTTQTGKQFGVGQFILLVSAANSANYMHGQVFSYDTGTGALVVTVTDLGGSGTKADWNISVSGSQIGINQLTGDVTAGPASGTTAATIAADAITTTKILNLAVTTGKLADNSVTGAKFRQSAATTLVGNATGGAANVTDITLGSTLAFSAAVLQTGAMSGDITTSANSFATTIANNAVTTAKINANAVTYAKLQSETAATLLGNPTGGGAVPSEITLGATLAFSGSALQTAAQTGDVTTSANSFATTIANNAVTTAKINASAVTYAKLQSETASTLLGNPTGAGAVPSEITLGATLAFSGSALQTTAHTGDVTSSANSNAMTIAANAVTAAKIAAAALREVITASLAADQNNYAISGMSTKANVETIFNVTPTTSFQFTGFSATSVEDGKRIVIANVSPNAASSASGRMILIPNQSASSSSGNRVQFNCDPIPLMLMPGDKISFIYSTANAQWELEHGNRHASPSGFFDNWNDYTDSINSWSSGTGSSVGYNSSIFQSPTNSAIGLGFAHTGTTTTGRGVAGTPPFTLENKRGCMLFLGRVTPETNLSNGTDTYTAQVGFTDQGNNTTPQNGICWEYSSTNSALWQTATYNGGTATRTAIGALTVATNTLIYLGAFVNGTGTNAEYFYSTDGNTWVFCATAHTTNLPANTNTFGCGFGITKTAGTTDRQFDCDFHGHRVQRQRGA